MPTEQSNKYAHICSLMRAEISNCDFRIKQTDENQKKLNNLNGYLESYKKSVRYCDYLMQSLKPFIEDIQEHITERRKSSLHNINQALLIAGTVIPDSKEGIKFVFDGKDAWLETPSGILADRAEGSGYKGTSSVFVRSVVLGSNPQYLQSMLLDEPFAKVSPENSATLSSCLPIMAQDKQIILIEQKKEIYSNLDCVVFGFFKDDEGYTTIARE